MWHSDILFPVLSAVTQEYRGQTTAICQLTAPFKKATQECHCCFWMFLFKQLRHHQDPSRTRTPFLYHHILTKPPYRPYTTIRTPYRTCAYSPEALLPPRSFLPPASWAPVRRKSDHALPKAPRVRSSRPVSESHEILPLFQRP